MTGRLSGRADNIGLHVYPHMSQKRRNCDITFGHGAKPHFGSKYVIEGSLIAPDGQTVQIRAIWFIEFGTANPRFVTAYPLKGKRDL